MLNKDELALLIPEEQRKRDERLVYAIVRRVEDEASGMLFASPENRYQWMINRLRSYLLFPGVLPAETTKDDKR